MKQGVDSLAQWAKLTFNCFNFVGTKNKLCGNQKKILCSSQICDRILPGPAGPGLHQGLGGPC